MQLPNKQSTDSPPTFGLRLAAEGSSTSPSSSSAASSPHSPVQPDLAHTSSSRLGVFGTINKARTSPLVQSSRTLAPPDSSFAPPSASTSAQGPTIEREENTEAALAEIFSGHPRPHLRAPSFSSATPSFASPPLASPFPRRESVDAPRSYFSSPPPPQQVPLSVASARSRSHSSAPVVEAADIRQPNHGAWRSSQDISYGSRPVPISMASETSIERSNSRDREGSTYSTSYSSSRGIGIGSPPSTYDSRTGWRATTDSKAASYAGVGWNDESGGYGRSRSRYETSDWGPPSLSSSVQSGIGLSNMSPFSRGLAELANNPPDWRSRREYGLGAVGSGRRRGESAFDTNRAVREEQHEDDDAHTAAPTRSGATSRRHSVATFDRPSRSQFGFEMSDSRRQQPNFGGGNGSHYNKTLPPGGFGGGSAIDDDDLAADLDSLRLNLERHAQKAVNLSSSTSSQTETPTPREQQKPMTQLGSLQLYSPEFPAAQQDSKGIPPLPSAGQGAAPPAQTAGFELPPTMLSPFGEPSSRSALMGGAMPSSVTASNFAAPAFATIGQPAPPFFTPAGFDRLTSSSSMPPLAGSQQQAGALPSTQAINSYGRAAFVPPGAPIMPAGPPPAPSAALGRDESGLGRGVPLHSIPPNAALYIVEFKAGRKDLFYSDDPSLRLRQGDLVIVEADRGRDLGKFFKPCSLDEVQAFQQRLVEMALGQLAHGHPDDLNKSDIATLSLQQQQQQQGAGQQQQQQQQQPQQTPTAAAISRITKEFAPKRLYGKAQPSDTQALLAKAQDEVKALALVRSKVAQKNLPMEVCDAEWQFDHKKLTLYYTSRERVDFRELVRELFRTFKARIWMCCIDQQSSAWDFK